MSRSKCVFTRWLLVFLCASAAPAGNALAANRFALPQLEFPEGAVGRTVDVLCEHDQVAAGFGVVINYDPLKIQVTGVTLQGTNSAGADLFAGSFLGGHIAYGCILDSTPPFTRYLEPSTRQILMRITLDVLATAGNTADMTFEPSYDDGTRIFYTELVDRDGNEVLPLDLENGKITVVAPGAIPPIAGAGGDLVVAEGATVTLDGSGSQAQQGQSLSFLWAQVLPGPAVVDPSAPDAVQYSFTAPGVDADTTLTFKLTVTEAGLSSSDEVRVRVIDLSSRTTAMTQTPATGGVLAGGTQALVFQGDIVWTSAQESGEWTYLRFTAGGKGNEANLLTGGRLFVDSNGDAVFGPEDEQIGDVIPIPGNDGVLQFNINRPLDTGVAETFYLVVDIKQKGKALGAWVLLPGVLFVGLWLLGRKSVPPRFAARMFLVISVGLCLSMPVFLSACGGGGGGGESREVRFDLLGPQDVGMQGFVTGVSVPAQAAFPLTGPTVEV